MGRSVSNSKLWHAVVVSALAGCAAHAPLPPPMGPYVVADSVPTRRIDDALWALKVRGIDGGVNDIGDFADFDFIQVPQSQLAEAKKVLARFD